MLELRSGSGEVFLISVSKEWATVIVAGCLVVLNAAESRSTLGI